MVACSSQSPPPVESLVQPPPTVSDPSPPIAEDITNAAMEVVLADERVSDFLAAHEYTVEGVTPLAGNDVLVTVTFVEPRPTAGWPEIDACELGGTEGPATGLDFQVDLERGQVVALSPRWGSVSCLSG